MKKELFRENAIKKVSSPEQLNEYIRVTNPGIWVTLVAIIILLIGVCVWGALGKIETTVTQLPYRTEARCFAIWQAQMKFLPLKQVRK